MGEGPYAGMDALDLGLLRRDRAVAAAGVLRARVGGADGGGEGVAVRDDGTVACWGQYYASLFSEIGRPVAHWSSHARWPVCLRQYR